MAVMCKRCLGHLRHEKKTAVQSLIHSINSINSLQRLNQPAPRARMMTNGIPAVMEQFFNTSHFSCITLPTQHSHRLVDEAKITSENNFNPQLI